MRELREIPFKSSTELEGLPEIDVAAQLNNHFQQHGWIVTPEVDGLTPKGQPVRLDAVLSMKEGTLISDTNNQPAAVIGIEYKRLDSHTDKLSDTLLQALKYTETVWDIPFDIGCYSSFKGRLPIFILPDWTEQIEDKTFKSFLGKQGLGTGAIRKNGNVNLKIRGRNVWDTQAGFGAGAALKNLTPNH